MSGERLWGIEQELSSSQLQITVNANILQIEGTSGGGLQAAFVFTVNFTPAIAQIAIRGRAKIQGEREEITKILQETKMQKPPPPLVQAVVNVCLAESVLIAKAIGVPPPLPPIPVPTQAPQVSSKDGRYTV